MGDPLTIANLENYLDLITQYKLKVYFVTSGFLVDKSNYKMLTHSAIKQVSFSCNSFNANNHTKTLKNYLDPLLDFVEFNNRKVFINFRLWNLDKEQLSKQFNKQIIDYISTRFDLKKINNFYQIAPKTRIVFDELFEWPNINNSIVSTNGFCHALSAQLGILNDGTVVPCCLDYTGNIRLGNIFETSLNDILKSNRSVAIKNGFAHNKIVEDLCQKCSYRTRFDKSKNSQPS